MIPKKGTLERVLLDGLMGKQYVTFLDFVGTGITEENIDQLIQNLRNGMYAREDDEFIEFDA